MNLNTGPTQDNAERTLYADDLPELHSREIVAFEDAAATTTSQTVFKEVRTNHVYDRDHTVVDFLKRPFRVHTGKWSVNDAQNQILYTVDLPDVLKSMTSIKDKIQGFAFLRASIVFTVRVNGLPYNAGALLLSYYPIVGLQKSTNLGEQMVQATLVTRGVLNLETADNRALCCAYTGRPSHWRVAETPQSQSTGTFTLRVYSPLTSSTSGDSINYTVWAHLDDIDIGVPTPMPPLIAQGLLESVQRDGLISNVANTVAEVSQMVPVVGEVVAPIAQTVSRIAQAFGFSKPLASETTRVVSSIPFRHTANMDGEFVGTKMTLNVQAEFDSSHRPDEMTVSHLAQTPVYFDIFKWRASDAPGTVIHTHEFTYGSYHTFEMGPADVIASNCGYWRGGTVLAFRIIKNKFYSGLLQFELSYDIGTGGYSENYAARKVVDIRTCSTVMFTIPYKNNKPWCRADDIVASLRVRVINELDQNNTVAPDINIIVERAAAPDFQVQWPGDTKIPPIATKKRSEELLEAQGLFEFGGSNRPGIVFNDETWVEDCRAGKVGHAIVEDTFHRVSAVDPLLSLKQLFQRPNSGFTRQFLKKGVSVRLDISELNNDLVKMFAYRSGGLRVMLLCADPLEVRLPLNLNRTNQGSNVTILPAGGGLIEVPYFNYLDNYALIPTTGFRDEPINIALMPLLNDTEVRYCVYGADDFVCTGLCAVKA